jgi:hypothetical protein
VSEIRLSSVPLPLTLLPLSSYVRWLGVLPALLVALAMLVPAAVQAKLYRRGGEFILNGVTESWQQVSDLAAMPDGGFVVVFHNPGGVAARRFDAEAQPLGPDVQVNARPTGPFSATAKVAVAPDGSLLVVWQQYLIFPEDSEPYFWGIAGRFFDADLHPEGEWFVISEKSGWSPAVAAVGPGQFVAVWEDNSTYSGRARLVSRSGMGKVIEVSDMQQENYFKVASRGDGSYWVVWHSEFSWIQGRGYRGEEPFAELPWIRISGAFFQGPELCAHANGDLALAWAMEPLDPDHWGENSVSYQRVASSGQSVGSSQLVTPEITEPLQAWPAFACSPGGELLVAWSEGSLPRPHPLQGEMRGRVFPAEDSRAAAEFGIGRVKPDRGSTAVAALRDGEWLIAWTDCDGNADLLECDVFGQRFTSSGPMDCPGDCNRDGVVTIDEVLLATRSAFDYRNASAMKQCLPADVNLDYVVTIDELVLAVRTALGGCP